jgi:hypothetical protein
LSSLRIILAGVTALIALVFAMPVVVLGLPFILGSYLVGHLASRLEGKCIQWPDIFEFDAKLGWKAKPNLNCFCLEASDDVFHVLTDEHGWPGSQSVENSDMVVLGDSHAFSYGVDHEKSFSQLNGGVKIKAVGVPGYNMVQELMLLEELAPKLRHKQVVWFCYVGNDLFDNLSPEMLGYRAPFLRRIQGSTGWEVVTSHLASQSWTCSAGARTLRRSGYPLMPALHSDTVFSQRVYSACESLIERGYQICKNNAAQLVVACIPDPFALDTRQIAAARNRYPFLKNLDQSYPDEKLQAICNKIGIRFIALKDHLELDDYKRLHDHWTERGHRRVAKVLYNIYRESDMKQHRNKQKDKMSSEPRCAH